MMDIFGCLQAFIIANKTLPLGVKHYIKTANLDTAQFADRYHFTIELKMWTDSLMTQSNVVGVTTGYRFPPSTPMK